MSIIKNLRELPKLRDSISYIYIEHAVIEQDNHSMVVIREDGRIPIPVSSLTCLLLGPGTKITHAAIVAAASNGCMIVWCGEKVQYFYASGIGETRSAENILLQARLCMDEELHLKVVQRMYIRRFGSLADESYSIQQLRGLEGVRTKEAYKLASKKYGIPWRGRSYKTTDRDHADPINQALSYANRILYGICHAGIISLGFSPALGFIHTGKQLSFVYDIADLYKADISIPAAFAAVKESKGQMSEDQVRRHMRIELSKTKLLTKIPEDLEWIMQVETVKPEGTESIGKLWDDNGTVEGGKNWGEK